MAFYINFIHCILFGVLVNCQEVVIISNVLDDVFYDIPSDEGDHFLTRDKQTPSAPTDRVEIKLYYECLCPDCREFDTNDFVPVVQNLSEYLDVQPYPYGNAKTIDNNGQYEFKCQHGPEECYGNKLHACSIDVLKNITSAVLFNACMMSPQRSGKGSDDAAATTCGQYMDIDPEPIKECAKSPKGSQLLKHYGDESEKVGFRYVPYIMINGVVNDDDHFMRDVCAAFKNPPQECKQEDLH